MTPSDLETSFHRLHAVRTQINEVLEEMLAPYNRVLREYHGKDIRLEQLTIDNISNGNIIYSYNTSFRGEWDDTVHATIPIVYMNDQYTIAAYYKNIIDERQAAEKAKEAEEERLRKEQSDKDDLETYQRLKARFESI